MSCPQCDGVQVTQHDYCRDCGASQLPRAPRNEHLGFLHGSTQPLLRLRPLFSAALQLESHAAAYLFLVLWGTLFFGGATSFLFEVGRVPLPAWAPLAVTAAALSLLVPALGLQIARATYRHSEFLLYPRRLDYVAGVKRRDRRSLPLIEVRGVNVRLAPGQPETGLGTILIDTANSRAGVEQRFRVANVPGALAAAERLRTLVEAARSSEADRREAA